MKLIISLGLLLVSMAVGQVRAYTVVDLGELGNGGSTATAINVHGDVVGYSLIGKYDHAFLAVRGTRMRDLGAWGALAVNASDLSGSYGSSEQRGKAANWPRPSGLR